MQSPGHEPFVDAYLSDLEDVVELVALGEITARGAEANYNVVRSSVGRRNLYCALQST